jgi:RNA polymerase sigma factor (sigma-70 family)
MPIFAINRMNMEPYSHIFEDFSHGKFESFYESMYPEMLIVASHLLGKNYVFLAEDCVQDSIYKTYNYHKEKPFTSVLHWKNYLYVCLKNATIDVIRKGNLQQKYLKNKTTEETAKLIYIEQETYTVLFSAVNSLPVKYKEVFDMSFEEGLKIKDIASKLNISEDAVKKRKAKLIQLLRDKLKGQLSDDYIIFICFFLLRNN